jgi:hypothetical protein
MTARFRVTFKSGRVIAGTATDYDEAAVIASRMLDPDHPESSAQRVDLLVSEERDERMVAHD